MTSALGKRAARARGAVESFLLEPAPAAPAPATAPLPAPAPAPCRVVVATAAPGAGGGAAAAAALAVSCASGAPWGEGIGTAPMVPVLLADLESGERPRGATLLASDAARVLEGSLAAADPDLRPAARGHVCVLSLPPDPESLRRLAGLLDSAARPEVAVVRVPPELWLAALELERRRVPVAGGLLRADPRDCRSLVALATRDLGRRGMRLKVTPAPGPLASRRALAGVEAGGGFGRRIARLARGLLPAPPGPGNSRAQALPALLGAALALVAGTLAVGSIVGAATGKGRVQRAADLAAVSGARSMRDDFDRLMAPPVLPNGTPNPYHMPKPVYLLRARAAALQGARQNGVPVTRVRISFPDALSPAPVRVRTNVRARIEPDPGFGDAPRRAAPVTAWAVAEAAPPLGWTGMPGIATGGGYSGPLAYRQGKGMRPDVAAAFDRLAAAARRAGLRLVITSAFRSDAEQARLFARNPDPRWVAPPGRSLHRCATELDLGPPAAYRWLAANAPRFGFKRRYSWEAWHFGYVRGPTPCSAAGNAGGGERGGGGVPSFVPARYRPAILSAAARYNVSAGLLAAQIKAESNFNPRAVSPAGARGIAQFMPATARAYGLRNPFDPVAAIHAQARMMSDLLRRFRSVPLALAAYNAGPGAVAGCRCIPYAETRAYVTRILGLLNGIGDLLSPPLDVRLVK